MKWINRTFITVLFLLSFVVLTSADDGSGLGDLSSPPRLRDLEPLLVQVVYIVWAFGGFIFTFLLMVIGFQYMISMGDQQKQQELKSRGKNWIIGLIVFFIGYPIIVTVYSVIGIGETNTECYKDIKTPGFHFFFPEVCTDPEASGSKYSVGSKTCSDFSDEEQDLLKEQGKVCGYFGLIFPINTVIQNAEDTDRCFSYNEEGKLNYFSCEDRDIEYYYYRSVPKVTTDPPKSDDSKNE